MAASSSTAPLDVDYALAAAMARHLSMFAELPSTPGEVADEAAAVAREVTLRLPSPPLRLPLAGRPAGGVAHRAASAPTTSVTLDRETVVSCAGLLAMLAAMPSTPPSIRREAEEAAESLWGLASQD